ncbi:MAG TPA: HypC/HybG/HupF family hydrogenase formation chaperone [Candidatus Eremiobacteraeota bacterium]|nr:MAG: Hydrogenase isoenzymes formation protein HypC [bacterium ADurb.Bin363]HPZ08338.1 HypC/HybG/HupF family hydrogenase formation chaperone [Candidatus Eremiobacteraeota bacterium]
MCLAIPGKVLEINGDKGLIDISGMKVETFLNLLEDVKIGDYILIHAGFAIERLPEEEAMERFKLFKEMEILG